MGSPKTSQLTTVSTSSPHLASPFRLVSVWAAGERTARTEQPQRRRYLDRVHGEHHRVLQYACHGSGCHVGRHGDMRRQALVVPVAALIKRLPVFVLDLRHLQPCHRTVRAQLHAWGALATGGLPYKRTIGECVGGMDNHNITTTYWSSYSARRTSRVRGVAVGNVNQSNPT